MKYHLLTKPVTCVPSTTLQCSDLPYYIHIRGKVYMIYTLVNWLSYNIEAYYIVPIGKWLSKFSNWNLVICIALLCSGWPFPRNVNVEIVLECTTFGNAIYILIKRISGVMISVIFSSAINRGFEPRAGQTKDYAISICCFSAKHAALRRKSKYWLARNENIVSEWGDMSIRGLLFRWAGTITIHLSVLV